MRSIAQLVGTAGVSATPTAATLFQLSKDTYPTISARASNAKHRAAGRDGWCIYHRDRCRTVSLVQGLLADALLPR